MGGGEVGVGGGFQCLILDMQSSQMLSGCPVFLFQCKILGLQSSQILGSCSMVPEGSMGSSARGVSVLGSAMGA